MIPTKKVTTGVVTGILVTIVMWILTKNDIAPSTEVATLITSVCSFLASYIAPPDTYDSHGVIPSETASDVDIANDFTSGWDGNQ